MIAFALMIPAAAWPDDGWSAYTNVEESAPVGVPAGFVNTPTATTRVEDAVTLEEPPAAGAQGEPGGKGDKGDRGDTGPQGPAGPQGVKGDPADLCQNIPGAQIVPGSKYNAQRYWGFLPKWEKRYLTVNRKRQIVCVTLRWIRAHS